MLRFSFYEWRCIDAGEQIILAPFLGKTRRDRRESGAHTRRVLRRVLD